MLVQAGSSVVERQAYTLVVTGSNPVRPTNDLKGILEFFERSGGGIFFLDNFEVFFGG